MEEQSWRIQAAASTRAQEAELRYGDDLQRAQAMSHAAAEASGFLTVPCSDVHGRPVVLVIANRAPVSAIDAEGLYLYVISCLDRIADEPYSVLYVHTEASTGVGHASVLSLRATYERCAALAATRQAMLCACPGVRSFNRQGPAC